MGHDLGCGSGKLVQGDEGGIKFEIGSGRDLPEADFHVVNDCCSGQVT